MSLMQRTIYQNDAKPTDGIFGVTIGYVVNTNDPMQLGRVQIICPKLGESMKTPLDDVPWAIQSSPLAGISNVGTRGPGIDQIDGTVAYGFWGTPVVGTQVLITFVDGNPNYRVYLGCLHEMFLTHTLPNGRWMFDDHPALDEKVGGAVPFGPYASNEKLIQPLANNLKLAFGTTTNYEWQTRAADYQASAVDISHLDGSRSNVADDKDVDHKGWNSQQGYQTNRHNIKEGNLDNSVYSWTSPGFHSISMDDRQENCRMRLRTAAGHQIIMDDTNERIYICTAKGNNWIEMDQAGNIEMFTTGKIAARSNGDINFTSDSTVRILGQKGIHLVSGGDVRIESVKDTHIKTGKDFDVSVASNHNLEVSGDKKEKVTGTTHIIRNETNIKASEINLQTTGNLNIKTGGNIKLTASGNLNILSQSNLRLKAAGVNILGESYIALTSSAITTNGRPAQPAEEAQDVNPTVADQAKAAFWTNRVPSHEPYARVSTADDFSHAPEMSYDDPNIGRIDSGVAIERGKFWRR